MINRYDITIIGAGPAGHTAALNLALAGEKVVLFEKEGLGGVCLNEGCIPAKLFLHSSKLYKTCSEDILVYGVEGNSASFNQSAMLSRKEAVVNRLSRALEYKLRRAGVTLVFEKASVTKCEDNSFSVKAGGEEYDSENLIIACGLKQELPAIKGAEAAVKAGRAYFTKDALKKECFPENMVIIGGGVAGIEFAVILNNLGVHVSLLEMEERLIPSADPEFSDVLGIVLAEEGIDVILNAKAEEIKEDSVLFTVDGEENAVSFDEILLCTGRVPVSDVSLGAKGLFVIGDALGKGHLAHSAMAEAENAAKQILTGAECNIDYDSIPAVIYISPEAAYCGLTEERASEKGFSPVEISVPIEASGRFHAENEGDYGLFKFVFDKETHTLLGAFIICDYASEIIELCHTFIKLKTKAEDICELIFPHPTNGELIHEAAAMFLWNK
ncbi:MAG: NAD(P)/FAD-dependent oxidoreductase [Lachnospiraceae bacterium]|nr:NAD(P)/FAD-dependent oxidoreductase [Lachnospiraceae bacterium]